jgi:hypothetical protein
MRFIEEQALWLKSPDLNPRFQVRVTVRKPVSLESQTVKGDDARIEARSLMPDARVSRIDRRASIPASTTVNDKLNT